jgi:hypothetical protein
VREKYCWLVAGGWFVLREKYCWLVADKPNEHNSGTSAKRDIIILTAGLLLLTNYNLISEKKPNYSPKLI